MGRRTEAVKPHTRRDFFISARAAGDSFEEAELSLPYRIRNPSHGVTDVRHSEPPAGPARVIGQRPAHFSAEVYFAAAEMLALEGHLRPALRAAERGMEVATPEPEAEALYAWLLYRCERAVTAKVSSQVWTQIDRALARDSSCALAHFFKSVLLQRSGELQEARWHLQRGREVDRDQSAADRALALLDDE